MNNYWTLNRGQVLDFENNLMNLISENDAKMIFTQMQNYIFNVIKSNPNNKPLYYRLLKDLNHIEEAKKQVSLSPAMPNLIVVENLSFKMILQ